MARAKQRLDPAIGSANYVPIESTYRHPVTGTKVNPNRICGTCAHFTSKTSNARGVKIVTVRCALDPEARNLADNPKIAWASQPACEHHKKEQL